MRRHARALFVTAALCSFFAIGAAPAIANYGIVGAFGTSPNGTGGSGSGDGELSNPGQADVNDETGRLYVADTGNDRIEVFKPTAKSGEYESQAAITAPTGLAIDQANGNVYVANAAGISKFTAALAPAGGWTDPGVTGALAVDPSSGDLLVADTAGNLIRRYNSDGSADGSFAAERPVDLAANSEGDVFVVTTTGDIGGYPCGSTSAVERFSPAGASEGTLPSLTVPGAVAIDPDDDSIVVGAKVNEYFCELGNLPELVFFTDDGSFVEVSQLNNGPTMYSSIPGLTMQGDGSNRVYAITKSPMNDVYGITRVSVLEDLPGPQATIGTATEIGAFSATVQGEVNPEGSAATCRFEYSTDTSFSQSAPCVTNPGAGTSPVPVQAKLVNLATDTEYNFRLVATNNGGVISDYSSAASFTTAHAEKPTATIAPPTEITGTTAKLSGTIDPLGNPATYQFEYQRVADGNWLSVPGGAGSAGSGSGPVSKEVELKGLFTNNTYKVRLRATNGAGPNFSGEEEFTTSSAAPLVETLTAGQIAPTSAMLRASINPAGEATAYYFEWGTSTAYGSRLPAADDLSAGSGNFAVFGSRQLTGLQPNTVYHYRVIAENGTGVSEGEDQSFRTAATPAGCANEAIRERQGMQYLPDCRAFELVSPPQKYGNDIITPETSYYNNGDFAPTASVSGDVVAFTSHGPFAGAESHPVYSVYRAVRGADGWSTESLVPFVDGSRYSSPAMFFMRFNDALTNWAVIGPPGTQMTADASQGSPNAFLGTRQPTTWRLLTPGTPAESSFSMDFAGWSDDQDTILLSYYGNAPLTPEAPPGIGNVLYQWNGDTGELSLVGKQPGTDLPFEGATEIADQNLDPSGGPTPEEWNPVSDDGTKVYFYAPAKPNQQLYLRLNGTETVHVSASQASVPDPNGEKPARFHYASVDGSTAFLSSPQKLTDDATTGPGSTGSDLYRYDVASEELTDITVDSVDPAGAEVQGVLGGSDDAKRLYFVARGVLDEGAELGAENLYLWTDDGSAKGSIEFVSQGVDSSNWHRIAYPDGRRLGRVTPDGMHALFQSTDQLSAYDNNGQREVYVYDAASDKVTCASCNPSGAPATTGALALGSGDDQSSARLLSDDGRFAFFNTTEALVATDVNNRNDAYQYDAERDRVDLISTGTSEYPAEFVDASADGSNVVIETRQKLLSIDFDDNIDVYTARAGGGFLSQSPPPAPVPCFGEACRTEPVVPPTASNPASSTMSGKGNVSEQRKKNKKQKNKKKQKKKNKSKKSKNKSKQKKGKSKRQGGRR